MTVYMTYRPTGNTAKSESKSEIKTALHSWWSKNSWTGKYCYKVSLVHIIQNTSKDK